MRLKMCVGQKSQHVVFVIFAKGISGNSAFENNVSPGDVQRAQGFNVG